MLQTMNILFENCRKWFTILDSMCALLYRDGPECIHVRAYFQISDENLVKCNEFCQRVFVRSLSNVFT